MEERPTLSEAQKMLKMVSAESALRAKAGHRNCCSECELAGRVLDYISRISESEAK